MKSSHIGGSNVKEVCQLPTEICVKHKSKSKCQLNTNCSADCRRKRRIRGLDPRSKHIIRARITRIHSHFQRDPISDLLTLESTCPEDQTRARMGVDPSSDPSPMFLSSISSLFCSIFIPCFTYPLSSNEHLASLLSYVSISCIDNL